MSTFVKKVTSAVAALSIVFSVVSPIAGVSAAYTSVDAANKLATLGVIVDNSANPADYRLGDTLTRNEGVKVMMNLSSVTVVDNCNGDFADLTSADWACKYAETALANGMVAGNANFDGERLLSNIEALKMVFQGRDLERNDNTDWRAGYVDAGVEMGINNAFTDYDTAVTRGQFFIWAANAIDAEDVVVEDDLLCEILGTCSDDDEDEDEDDDTPVVPSGDDMLEVSLSPLSPTANAVAAGKPRTALVAFDVTAGSSDVTLDEVTLEYIGLSDDDDFDVLAVYMGNDKITKGDSKSFDSDGESELSFENDTVIMAGETKTLVVTATVTDSTTNSAHQVRIMDLEASSDVMLGTVQSVVFDVISATNTASLDVTVDLESGKETVGETATFADFNVEADDKEDVVVKSMTFEFGGSADVEDDIADIVLMADGEMIADDLTLNSDDEIIVDIDYTVEADEDVDFELEGVVTGSIGDTLTVTLTDLYAVGADTGVIADLTGDMADNTELTANVSEIEGAEINVSWDKGDIDEVKPDTKDVVVGTLNVEAAGDYVINSLRVDVDITSGASNVEDVLTDIELDGKSSDSEANVNTQNASYTFEDINLSQGMEEMLELTVEIEDDAAINGTTIEFDIVIVEVEDEENDETFTSATTPDLNSILSSNSFDTKSIDIETASYTLTQTSISTREIVLGNGIEVVLYQAKLNIGDSDDVTFEDFRFTGVNNLSNATELEDIIDSATLNIGGVTEDADISGDDVDFVNTDIEVAAGANNVEVLVTAVLKDDDDIVNGDDFRITLTAAADIDASDSNNDDISAVNETINAVASTNTVELNENGTFTIAVVNDGENEDDIEDVVLAGTMDVTLAEVVLEAEEEDMDVEELRFTIPGAFDTTVKNVRLMDGSTVIADGATVTLSGGDTVIEFEDFVVEDTGTEIDATLVADLEIITDEGGVPTASAGDITVNALTAPDMDVEGASSNDTITVTLGTGNANSNAVAVVPVLVTASIVDTLGNNDEFATVAFAVDFGNNELDNDDLYLTTVAVETATGTILLRNDEGTLVPSTTTAGTPGSVDVTAIDALARVNDGDEFEFDVNGADESEIRVTANGFSFVLDLDGDLVDDGGDENVTSSNDSTLNFGQYNDVN